MQRAHAVLAALVAGAALWAWLTVHPPGGGSGGEADVPVWQLPLRSVQALIYDDGTAHAEMRLRWDEGARNPVIWMETRASDAAWASPAGGPPPPSTERFRGNAAALEVLERLAGLVALRDLGRLDALEAAAFGLLKPEGYVELTRTSAPPLRLELGRGTYGQGGRYALVPADGHVYLLRSTELRRLAGAQGGLMDRELLGLPLEEAARAELALGGRTRTLYRLADPGSWGATPDASEAVPDMAALVTALGRLKVQRYLAADAPALSAPPALVLRLFRADGAAPASSLELFAGAGQVFRARSTHTESQVEVPSHIALQVLEAAHALVPGP